MSSLHRAHHVVTRPWESLFVFLGVFFILSSLLFIIDFVPEEPELADATGASVPTTAVMPTTTTVAELTKAAPVQNVNLIAGPTPAVTQVSTGIKPTRIVVQKVGVDTVILNPVKSDLASLDDALLSGAVRYPGTAHMNEEGSVVIFGHQSYLPVVHNKAFKAFNDLQNLEGGDIISVYAGTTEFRYAVRSVTLTNTDAGSIALETKGQTLTLVTCNSLGAKEERYVVKADLIGTFTN
jgi:LPXTG-site transpeptidase (sortase) family protein